MYRLSLVPQQRYERLRECAAIIAETHAYKEQGGVPSQKDEENVEFAMKYAADLGITNEEATYLTAVARSTLAGHTATTLASVPVPESFRDLRLGTPRIFE